MFDLYVGAKFKKIDAGVGNRDSFNNSPSYSKI